MSVTAVDGSDFSATYITSQSTTKNNRFVSFDAILSKEQKDQKVSGNTLDAIFQRAAKTYGVDADLLKAVAKAESNFTVNATSTSGAQGIMQLMPATAKALGVTNAYDPEQNIMGGAKLLSSHLKKYNGNIAYALAAYNAGSGAVDKYHGIPPYKETQNYVQKILSDYQNGINLPNMVYQKADSVPKNQSTSSATVLTPAQMKAEKKHRAIQKMLEEIPDHDLILTSNQESEDTTAAPVKSETSTGSTARITSENPSDNQYSYEDYLQFVNDYLKIVNGSSEENNSDTLSTSLLNDNGFGYHNNYTASVLNLLKSQLTS